MKKVYLFLVVLGISATSFSQNLNVQLFDHDGNDVTNGVYAIPQLHPSAPTTDVKFVLKNNSAAPIDVKVRRTVDVMPTGYQNAICFGETCFPAESDTTGFEHNLEVSVLDSSFKITIFNNDATTGDFSVVYYVYDINNPSQSVSVKVYYGNGINASVTENVSEAISISAYPNPASGSVLIKHNLTSDGQLMITDITGKTLKSIRLNGNSQSTQVDISDLRSGVYIYSIQSGSKRIISKKLVVR